MCIGYCAPTSTPCPDFVILGLLCRCSRHATKIVNHHSKAETISKLTVHSQLLQNYFHLKKSIFCKCRSYDRVSKVRAHYPIFPKSARNWRFDIKETFWRPLLTRYCSVVPRGGFTGVGRAPWPPRGTQNFPFLPNIGMRFFIPIHVSAPPPWKNSVSAPGCASVRNLKNVVQGVHLNMVALF